MFRRFVGRQVSQTYYLAALNATGETHLGLSGVLDVASSNQLQRSRQCLHTERSTTSSIQGNLRLARFPKNARGSSVLADLRCVSGLETLNDELAEAVVKDRATARIRLYNEIMWHAHNDPSSGRPIETRTVGRPVHTSDLSHLTVRSQHMSTFRFTRPC